MSEPQSIEEMKRIVRSEVHPNQYETIISGVRDMVRVVGRRRVHKTGSI